MFVHGRLVVVVMLLFVVGWSHAAAQETTIVDMTVFVDRDSLTVYVPGNQPVSLQDVGFQVIQGELTVTRFLQEYPAFGVDWGRVQPPVCFRLIRHASDSVPPLECGNAQLFTQSLANANIFWYDSTRSQPFTFSVVRGINPIMTCPAEQPTCLVRFEVSISIPTSPELPPTPAASEIKALVQIADDCPADTLERMSLDPTRFAVVDDGTPYDLVVAVACNPSGQRLSLTVSLNTRRLDQVIEPGIFTVDNLSFRLAKDVLLSGLERYVSGENYRRVVDQLEEVADEPPDQLLLLRANSLLFARCYRAAIDAYTALSASDGVLATALHNNRGVAWMNLAFSLYNDDFYSAPNCPDSTLDTPASVSADNALSAAYADFEAAAETNDVDMRALAFTNWGTALYLVDRGDPYDLARGKCSDDTIYVDGVLPQTRALAHLCYAGVNILDVDLQISQRQYCDSELVDEALDLLDGLDGKDALYWRGRAYYTLWQTKCTSAESVRNSYADQYQESFTMFLDRVQAPGSVCLALDIQKVRRALVILRGSGESSKWTEYCAES